MNHASSAAAAKACKHALYDAIKTALAAAGDIDISFGLRWPIQHDDAVAVTSVTSDPNEPAHGAARSREDEIRIGVVIAIWRNGFDEATEIEATDRAYELLDLIDVYLRTGDNITLGGNAMWVLLDHHECDGWNEEDAEGASTGGRIVTVAAQFVAHARISNH